MHPHISLICGVTMNRQHPRTFEIPSDFEKSLVMPGDWVKLGFEQIGRPHNERMWVKVTDIFPNGRFRGVLDNDPVVVTMTCGEVVTFHSNHILAINVR